MTAVYFVDLVIGSGRLFTEPVSEQTITILVCQADHILVPRITGTAPDTRNMLQLPTDITDAWSSFKGEYFLLHGVPLNHSLGNCTDDVNSSPVFPHLHQIQLYKVIIDNRRLSDYYR
ncbi:MAG: hypothetical protein COV67_09290 [Nitrospinae bacterium CG11_big_fil_rev_8_21_14_0_20_56_8]|nr:MAG: hypothetical protein COV67_09290 [Nitrospinae bacterium CG11_big_fil_rev_8_21_14_0_20_56_8]